MTDNEEEESEFRVVDRRRFNEDKPVEQEVKTKPPPALQNVDASPHTTDNLAAKDDELMPVDFPSFIVGLATQAMMLLGEMPEPGTGRRMEKNLPAARQTVDIIALLQEKTKGNLSADESKLIQDVLTSLRMSYVQAAKSK